MSLITVADFTPAELEGVQTIRNRLKHLIPPEYDTDFFLARWWKTLDGDLKLIEKRMKEWDEHRKIFGYGHVPSNRLEIDIEIAKKTFERFSVSSVCYQPVSGNVCVHWQRLLDTEFKEILKTIPISYILHSYFILQEGFTRTLLAREAETGKPAAVVSILDLEGLCLSDFVNPLGGPARLARLVVKIWADYFKEGLVKLIMVNPPKLLNVIWQIAKFIMDKKMLSRILILEDCTDLMKYLRPEAVPEMYGGKWKSTIPTKPLCSIPLRVTPDQYYDATKLWIDHGYISVPDMSSTYVKSRQTVEYIRKCERNGQTLLWHFSVNGDIEFSVVRVDGDSETTVWPKITLTTTKVPEQGSILCQKGDYLLRLTNPNNSWTPLKLSYVFEMSST